tara:strand:+ start:1438 stop:2655 length:1218 start_codon:yes stop_codon:yes gene_type:complete
MAKWTVKGVVDDEPKTKQETEQAVLDKAVEKGEIEPEAAGKESEETPKIDLDAVQKQSTDEVPVRDEPTTSEKVQEENIENKDEDTSGETQEDESPIEIVNEEETPQVNDQPKVDQRAAEINEQPQPVEQTPQVELPENIDKLIKFMDETGGTLEDYVNMNRDVSDLSDGELLRQYYSQSKPWDSQEINEYMEDNFSYDEEEDEPRDIRSKKRAFKEELHNARKFFNNHKEKYYADLKLNRQKEIPQDYQEAYNAYGEYTKEQELNKQLNQVFLERTDSVFNDDFRGFDFQVGDNKYRYKVNNVNETKRLQSDISNFIKPFMNDKGEIGNVTGYHKALFAARNADKLAQHFYEQGRADALKQSAKDAKNIDMTPRQEGTIQTKTGQKFKVVSGDSSSKLRIKLKQ